MRPGSEACTESTGRQERCRLRNFPRIIVMRAPRPGISHTTTPTRRCSWVAAVAAGCAGIGWACPVRTGEGLGTLHLIASGRRIREIVGGRTTAGVTSSRPRVGGCADFRV